MGFHLGSAIEDDGVGKQADAEKHQEIDPGHAGLVILFSLSTILTSSRSHVEICFMKAREMSVNPAECSGRRPLE